MSINDIAAAINGTDFAKFLSVVSQAEDKDLREALEFVEFNRKDPDRVVKELKSRQDLDEHALALFFGPHRPRAEWWIRGDGWSEKGYSEASKQAKYAAIKAGSLALKFDGLPPLQLGRMRALLSAAGMYFNFFIYTTRDKHEGRVEFIDLFLKFVHQQVNEGEQKGESGGEAKEKDKNRVKQIQRMVHALRDENWLQHLFNQREVREVLLNDYHKRVLLSAWYRRTVDYGELSFNDGEVLLEDEHLYMLLTDRRPEDKVIASKNEILRIFPDVGFLIRYLKDKSPQTIAFIFENIPWECWLAVLTIDTQKELCGAFADLFDRVPGKEQWINGFFNAIKKAAADKPALYQSFLESLFPNSYGGNIAFATVVNLLEKGGDAEGLMQFRREHLTPLLVVTLEQRGVVHKDVWKSLFPTIASLKAYVKEDQNKESFWRVLKALREHLNELTQEPKDVLEILKILALVPRPESEPHLFPIAGKIGEKFSGVHFAWFLKEMSSSPKDFKDKDIINWAQILGLKDEEKRKSEAKSVEPAAKIAAFVSDKLTSDDRKFFFAVVDFSKIKIMVDSERRAIFPTANEFIDFLRTIPEPEKWLLQFFQSLKSTEDSSALTFISEGWREGFEAILDVIPSYAVNDFLKLYTREQIQKFYKNAVSIKDHAAFLKLIRKAPVLLEYFKGSSHVDRLYKNVESYGELLDILYVLPKEQKYRDAFFALFSNQAHLHMLLDELHNYLDYNVHDDDDTFQAYVHVYRTAFQREAKEDKGITLAATPALTEINPEEAFDHFTDVALEIFLRYRKGIIDKDTGQTAEYKGKGPEILKKAFGDPWQAKVLAVERFRILIKPQSTPAQSEEKDREKEKDRVFSSSGSVTREPSITAEVQHALTNGDVGRIHNRWKKKQDYISKANQGRPREDWNALVKKGSVWERVTQTDSLASRLVPRNSS